MTSKNFDIDYAVSKSDINSKLSNIQIKLSNYFETLVNEKRFMNEEQVLNFLFKNTNFTDEEKMMVSYYFVNKYLVWCGAYDKAGSYSNIDKIVLSRLTPCNGFSLLLQSLLSKNGIECNLVGLEIKSVGILHANNIVILNKKVYYVDATWGVYYKEINKLPNSVVVSSYVGDSKYTFEYKKIKSLDYIIFMQKYHKDTKRKDVENILDLIKKGAY
jgi:transglutaminase/protease-like cytokinesis protein 3